MTVSGVEYDLLPLVVARLWLAMAFKALPEQTSPKAVGEKWGCHCQGNSGQVSSGEGWPWVWCSELTMNPGPVLLSLAFAACVHSAHTLPLHPPPLLIPSTPCVFLKAKQINSVLHGIKTDNTESAVYNIPNLFRILKLKFQSSAFMKQCCSFSLERCRKTATKWQ